MVKLKANIKFRFYFVITYKKGFTLNMKLRTVEPSPQLHPGTNVLTCLPKHSSGQRDQ